MTERIRKYNRYWLAGVMLTVLTIAGTGCKKETAQPPDTGVAAVDTTDTTGLVPDDPGLDDVPGRDTARTRAYLAKLHPHWTVAVERVAIHCDSECVPVEHDSVRVAIYTHKLTWKLDAKKLVDRSNSNNSPGHFALKIVNLDAFEYKPLGLLPNDSVYVWGGKTRATEKRAFAVFRIDAAGNATGVARAYRAIHCNLQSPPNSSNAHLQPLDRCEEGDTAKELLYNDVLQGVKHKPLHDQGLWFSCTGGCCQSSNFGPY